MIKYLKNDQINRVKWDACNQLAINEVLYAYSWYLDIICDEWDALVEDDYQTIFPLPYRNKFGIKYIYQPFFSQQLGLISQQTVNSNKLNLFLNSIPKDFKFIELNLNTYNQVNELSIPSIENTNYELDLISPYHELYNKYSDNLKRNLKKANSANLTITHHLKPEEIIHLFKDNMGYEIETYKERDYRTLTKLLYKFIELSIATLYGVYSETNELIAGAVFVRSKHKSIFIFSANCTQGKQKSAIPRLIDEHIKSSSGLPITLDFEGSNNPNLARFYKSFGSSKTHYYSLKENRLNIPSTLALHLYKSLKKRI